MSRKIPATRRNKMSRCNKERVPFFLWPFRSKVTGSFQNCCTEILCWDQQIESFHWGFQNGLWAELTRILQTSQKTQFWATIGQGDRPPLTRKSKLQLLLLFFSRLALGSRAPSSSAESCWLQLQHHPTLGLQRSPAQLRKLLHPFLQRLVTLNWA